MEILERNIDTNYWLIVSLLIIGLILMIAKKISSYNFNLFFKLDLLKSFIGEKERLRYSFNSTEILIFTCVIIIIPTILKLGVLNYINTSKIFYTTGVILLIIFVRAIIDLLVGYFFNLTRLIKLYLLTKFSALFFSLIILFPFFAIEKLNFNEGDFFISLIVGVFLLTNLTVISLQAYKQRNILLSHWFYFILYICSLEIAPLIIGLNWDKF